jgi:hypothetical protein
MSHAFLRSGWFLPVQMMNATQPAIKAMLRLAMANEMEVVWQSV